MVIYLHFFLCEESKVVLFHSITLNGVRSFQASQCKGIIKKAVHMTHMNFCEKRIEFKGCPKKTLPYLQQQFLICE